MTVRSSPPRRPQTRHRQPCTPAFTQCTGGCRRVLAHYHKNKSASRLKYACFTMMRRLTNSIKNDSVFRAAATPKRGDGGRGRIRCTRTLQHKHMIYHNCAHIHSSHSKSTSFAHVSPLAHTPVVHTHDGASIDLHRRAGGEDFYFIFYSEFLFIQRTTVSRAHHSPLFSLFRKCPPGGPNAR